MQRCCGARGAGSSLAHLDWPGGADLDQALAAVEATLAPAPSRTLQIELAALDKRCVRRRESAEDELFRVGVWVADLQRYPADIAIAALRQWADQNDWWPPWAAIRALCERLVAPRQAALDRLRRALARRSTAGQGALSLDGPPDDLSAALHQVPDPTLRAALQRLGEAIHARQSA